MQKKNSDELLRQMIPLLLQCLEELSKACALRPNDFLCGEKTAYTECLELLQRWEHAETNGLDFDIEARFPL